MQISNWLQSIRKLHIYDIFVWTLMLDRSLAKRLVPKKRALLSSDAMWRCFFFNLWFFPCLPPLSPWRKEGQTIWDKFWTVQFKPYSRSISVVWRSGFYWHKCFCLRFDSIPLFNQWETWIEIVVTNQNICWTAQVGLIVYNLKTSQVFPFRRSDTETTLWCF